MKNIFDQDTYNEIITRINSLTPTSPRKWGKMNVEQMMAHLNSSLQIVLSDESYKQSFLGKMVGWMMRKKLSDDSSMGKNLPTAKEFKIVDAKNFESEKKHLLQYIQEFYKRGHQGLNNAMHIFFGRLTGEEWGKSTYKHLDHHLKQFGA